MTKSPSKKAQKPDIIPECKHGIRPEQLSENALKVMTRLNEAGYEAYLVGGGVRDLLLQRTPKDFDVATDATPEEIKDLFRNCILIGRRFRLAHIRFRREVIEVATFRGPHETPEDHDDNAEKQQTAEGMLIRDNTFGTIETDVWRRDFTVNALYYSIAKNEIVDFVGGIADIKTQQIRLLGDAELRYQEDPVRMLRAIRLANKCHFSLHSETEQAILTQKHLLQHISNARLFDESCKLFQRGFAALNFASLRAFDLLQYLFPETDQMLRSANNPQLEKLVLQTMQNTDHRIHHDKPVTPAFIFASLLWYVMQQAVKSFAQEGHKPYFANLYGTDSVLRKQSKTLSIPKRHAQMIRDIWRLQHHLCKRQPRRTWQLLEHPRFRAAYDFLLLRAQAGEPVELLANWWTDFQFAEHDLQKKMVDALSHE